MAAHAEFVRAIREVTGIDGVPVEVFDFAESNTTQFLREFSRIEESLKWLSSSGDAGGDRIQRQLSHQVQRRAGYRVVECDSAGRGELRDVAECGHHGIASEIRHDAEPG